MRHALAWRDGMDVRITRCSGLHVTRMLCVAWLCLLCVAACAHPSRQADTAMQADPQHRDGIYTVVLPRPHRAGEPLMLEVELGTSGAGMQVVLRTLDGELVGTVSPHGIRHGAAGGTHLVPVPAHLLPRITGETRWRLQVRIESSANAPKPADGQTVRAVRAVHVGE